MTVSKKQTNREALLKGDKEKERATMMLWPSRHVLFQCRSQSFHPRPSCDSPRISLSPSQCLVRLTVITQKQIFSSENKVTHFSECVMPLHGYLLSHIILLVTTTCLLLFQDLTKMHNNRVTECCVAVC